MMQERVEKSYRYLYREHGEQCGAPSISSSGCILRNGAVIETRELWHGVRVIDGSGRWVVTVLCIILYRSDVS